MDILISSNLERLLYFTAGAEKTADYMKQLNENGIYTVSDDIKRTISENFVGFCADENCTRKTLEKFWKEYGYLADTHTSVALDCAEQYVCATGDTKKIIVASTASPYKFAADVLPAIDSAEIPEDGFALLEKLSSASDTPVPAPLAELKTREVLHKTCVEKEKMADFIRDFLG